MTLSVCGSVVLQAVTGDQSFPSLLTTAQCAAAPGPSSSWSPRLLSSSQLLSRLNSLGVAREQRVECGVVSEVHSNQYAANPQIEDTLSMLRVKDSNPGGILLGVFDGHSGGDASKWCRDELLPYLVYYRWSGRTPSLIHPRPFLDGDHHFLEFALRDKRMSAGLSGACLTVAHVAGNVVRTANAGDCRTIIGRRISTGDSSTAQYQAIELTRDHQIDTNSLERERLLREHPDEEDIIRKNRVKGRLQPTRGFGDGFYKRKEFFSARSVSRQYSTWTPPYTTVEPDITQYTLGSNDEFMVMATDGLFQDLNSQQVVDYVGEWLSLRSSSSSGSVSGAASKSPASTGSGGGLSSFWPLSSFTSSSSSAPSSSSLTFTTNASSYLIEAALKHASEHAIGRRSKPAENLSWIMQLPVEMKRNVHDDVSVIVVLFDHSNRFVSDRVTQASKDGPTIPPTLSRALASGMGTVSSKRSKPVEDTGIDPMRIPPIQPAIVEKMTDDNEAVATPTSDSIKQQQNAGIETEAPPSTSIKSKL